ncbi:MAG: HD domain-containing phosphohydrolase [Rhodospirillaceae bacterium]
MVDLVQQFLDFIDEYPKQSVRDLSRRVLQRCRILTGAEAGTIFVVRRQERNRWLEAVAVQNDAIKVAGESFRVPVDMTSIAGYVAITGQTVTIDDAYEIPRECCYRFNKDYDLASGYRTRSILCFALGGFRNSISGVVQLINRRPGPCQAVLPFLREHERMIAPVNHVVGRALERAWFMERISAKNRELRKSNLELRAEQAEVGRLQVETERAFMQSVELLARAAELHDSDTGNHILRVNDYSRFLAEMAGMPESFCEGIGSFAALHDVGKMSVDKAVLHKRGRLDAAELVEMQRHVTYGYDILSVSPRLAMAAEIARHHHEKWDGSGYPDGRRGRDIPIAARLVAIADVYDALRSDRPYKPGFSHERSVEIMTAGDERIDPHAHFDPELLRLFTRYHREFERIWDKLSDVPAINCVA